MEKDKKQRPKGGGGHRITLAEQNRRVEQLEICLAQGWHVGEIKRTYTALWNVSRYAVERYLRRARENLAKSLGESRDQHRARSLHFYRQILSDNNATTQNKISAQRNIDRLLGLPQPIMVAPTTPEGKSLLKVRASEMSTEALQAIVALRGLAEIEE